MATAPVSGTTLYYEESGSGPPLLFLHGTGGSANSWDASVERLARFFRCITYDRRGNLRSPLGDVAENDPAIHVQDAAELVRVLDLAPCLLIASSGGGSVAFQVIRQFPELLRGAVLAEPGLYSLDPDGGAAVLLGLRARIQPLLAGPDKRIVMDAFMDYIDPAAWAALPEHRREQYRDNYAALLRELQVKRPQVSVNDLRSVRVPCLILVGSNSYSTFETIGRALVAGIPDAELIEIEGAGHLIYLDKPDAFAEAIHRFARQLFQSAANR
jgi:pimeloyl-ACP methyl ester carboxylesterase